MSASARNKPILPGATIGILGSGQLGRMLAIAARQMGYRVHTLSPESGSPTGQIAEREVVAAYDDLDAVRDFARGVDVVTFEFENVSHAAAEAASEYAPVRPSGNVLHITQNRLREKLFLRDNGFPVTPFAPITNTAELEDALLSVGLPAVLKTAGFGYDGKGQRIVRTPEALREAWTELSGEGTASCILEGFVSFSCEASVVAARGVDGEVKAFPVVRNDHAHHILDITTAPAPETDVSLALATEARETAQSVLETLDVVGVLCVEYFITADGRLLINELAPRPHNSGHWTIEGTPASQFEQQLRAVCGLPLGEISLRRPAAMANLLGDLWEGGEPDWAAALTLPDVHLHLYGKKEPRPGRKMGHLTALADSAEEATALARSARSLLAR